MLYRVDIIVQKYQIDELYDALSLLIMLHYLISSLLSAYDLRIFTFSISYQNIDSLLLLLLSSSSYTTHPLFPNLYPFNHFSLRISLPFFLSSLITYSIISLYSLTLISPCHLISSPLLFSLLIHQSVFLLLICALILMN